MAKLSIKTYPDNILRKKSARVENIGDKERCLAYSMLEAMRLAGGVGLAAPQVGVNKRIIVAEDTEHSSGIVLINPRILGRRGRVSFCEGCLSVPGVTSEVTRPERITAEALNLDGEIITIETGGLFARILQHEIDHLDGILFIDRVSFLKRKKIMKQLSLKVCIKL